MNEALSTKAAAEHLRVSEASVRRWSDAGLLPVQRIGRRGTRRFAKSDLQAFAQRGKRPESRKRAPRN